MLRTYGELQLGPYANTDLGQSVVLEESKKVAALVDVIREANVKANDGVLAMPLSSSFVTVITVNVGADEDITTKIPVEARKYIPVPMSDVVLDWSELPPIGKTKSSLVEVLLAAIQSESLTDYNNLMQAVQMTSQPSEIEVFSTIRALTHTGRTTSAIIDLGARVSKLYIVRDGNLERIHRVTTGGEAITKKLASLLNTSFIEAENVKRTTDKDSSSTSDVRKASQAVLEAPLQEFKRIIDLYEERIGAPIQATVLVGGVAAGYGVASYVTDVLGKEATIGAPFINVAYPAFMEDTVQALGPIFAPSLGAALRPFSE